MAEGPADPVVVLQVAKKPAAPLPQAEEKKLEETAPTVDVGDVITQSKSFKEESNVVSNLVDPVKKVLDELKQLVQAALANNEFDIPRPPPAHGSSATAEEKASAEEREPAMPEPAAMEAAEAPKPIEESVASAKEEPLPLQPAAAVGEKAVMAEDDGAKTVESIKETASATPPEQVFIWGVPLLADERSDTVLLKFLRARDFKVEAAMAMLKNTVIWRKLFAIDALLEEDLGLPELEKAIFMHGVDRAGHPVCYNVYGEFQNQELYEKAFGDEEKRQRFLKWRIQYLEKGIREHLDFAPGGVCSMVQVTDMKNSPSQGKHRQVVNQVLALLQDNYPEFVAKKVFVNVSWWMKIVTSLFFTQRTKSKFVFAGPSRTAETLFKYIAPEQVPVAYGGLSKEKDPDFTNADAVTLITIKPSSKESIEIPVAEASVLVWELRVLGWEVIYGTEFVPSVENGYTVIVQKSRKMAAADEPVIKGSYRVGEPGKVVLNFENPTSKKKKLLYRFKDRSSTESSYVY